MDHTDTWLFEEPRLPNVVVGLISALILGGFAAVFLRAGDLAWVAIPMGLLAVASLAVCGYRRSVVLDRGRRQVRVRHAVFARVWERPIAVDDLDEVAVKRASTQSHHSVYYVTLVGRRGRIRLRRTHDPDEARGLQAEVAAFLDLPTGGKP